jgi:uncharacterized protein
MRTRVAGVSLMCMVLLLIGCTRSAVPMPPLAEPTSVPQAEVELPNPASAYCEAQGGTLDIRADDEGGQIGICVFADGSECEEWAFFRGECTPDAAVSEEPAADEVGMANPASVFCEEQGGTVDLRTDDDGGQVGFCVFADGSECDEWALFRGECTPGAAGYLPDGAEIQGFEFIDWQSYKNMAYALSLRFPPDWRVAEATDPSDSMAGHRVTLTSPEDPLAALYIAVKAATEDQQITPTGIGAGDLIERGSFSFLGEPLRRQALIAEDKTMGVLYGGGGEIVRGEHVFWIALNYAGSPLTDPGLSPEMERLTDLIIASLQIEP